MKKTRLKTYSHDYTLPAKVESLLYRAQQEIRVTALDAAEKHIIEARELLQKYLAQDNMVPDDDVADGWVKHTDISKLQQNEKAENNHEEIVGLRNDGQTSAE